VEESTVTASPSEIVGMLHLIRTSTLADILEEHGFHGAMDGRIRCVVNTERKMVGRAITMKKAPYRPDAPEARLSSSHHLFLVLNAAQLGDVLVIDAHGVMAAASFGDLAGRAARARGMVGAVCDGAVRDVRDLRTTGLSVYATGVHTSSGLKRLLSLDMNVPIRCGDVPVSPGDYVVGDEDGVVVVPETMAPAVIAAFRAEQTEFGEAAFIEATGDFLAAMKRFGRA